MRPTERFSSRVADYVKYRPTYPAELVGYLKKSGVLRADSVVADVGSGTGLLTKLFLENGNAVFAVEPNREMREAGEEFLRGFENFHSVAGTAETTTLADASIDLVAAGQAFHWFDHEKARGEFQRILKPGGHVALVWNERLGNTAFLRAYDELLKQFSLDYTRVDHRQITDAVIEEFFAPNPFTLTLFENQQVFDYASLEGRLRSSSYTPEAGHPKFDAMIKHLKEIFAAHQKNGQVSFEYETKMYVGQLRR